MISRFYRVVFLSIGAALSGCKSTHPSPGFHLGENTGKLPPGVPRRVGVALFAGESPINQQASDQLTAGLLNLGFDVIERSNFQAIIDELEISSSDVISEPTRAELGNQLALEAIFTGSVTGEESTFWIDSHINVKLVDIDTGRIIWATTAQDPRSRISRRKVRGDVKTSITYSVNEVLRQLKEALDRRTASGEEVKELFNGGT